MKAFLILLVLVEAVMLFENHRKLAHVSGLADEQAVEVRASPAIQAACAKQARDFVSQWEVDLKKMGVDPTFNDYTNHFDLKTQGCYVLITDNYLKNDYTTITKNLFDVNENKSSGEVTESSYPLRGTSAVASCSITTSNGVSKTCKSVDEFEKLAHQAYGL